MILGQIGELGAIQLFQEILAQHPSEGAIRPEIGIGDDAAVWKPMAGRYAMETTDLLIEEVHFSLRLCDWYDVGWKAMAVNISDIAAMGGRPRAAFVSAGLSPAMSREQLVLLYSGLADCASQFGVAILGGDTVASPRAAAINVALAGETLDATGAVLRRDTALPGQAVGVSGPLGASAAYLQRQDPEFRHAHLRPQPRVALGQDLLRAGIRCAMDISDGLLGDLGKLCTASHAGAIVHAERVPVAAGVRNLLPDRALELALTGGEDYELIACGDEAVLTSLGMTVIGRVTDGGEVRALDAHGQELRFASPGYDAFPLRP